MRLILHRITLLIFLCICQYSVSFSFAEHVPETVDEYNLEIQNISITAGLSNRFVRAVYQDSQGYIWLVTQHGINRYDGYEVKQYGSEFSHMHDSHFSSLAEDPQNNLWVVQSNEVFYINTITLEISNFELKFANSIIKEDNIHQVYRTESDNFLITTKDGQILMPSVNDDLEVVYQSPKRNELQIMGEVEGNIIISDLDGKRVALDSNWALTSTYNVPHGFVDIGSSGDRIGFMANYTGVREKFPDYLYQYDKLEGSLTPLPIDFDKLPFDADHLFSLYNTPTIYDPQSGAFWIITDLYCVLYHLEHGLIMDITNDLLRTNNIQSVYSVFYDRQNNLWVGTNEGAYRIKLDKSPFKTILSTEAKNDKVYKPYSTRGFTKIDSALYVSSTYGYTIANLNDGSNVPLKIEVQNRGISTQFAYGKPCLKDSRGQVWFGDYSVIRLDPSSGSTTIYNADKSVISWSLFEDASGVIWLGSQEGLYRVDEISHSLLPYTNLGRYPEVATSHISNIYKDIEGNIWLLSSNGIYLFDPEKGIRAKYSATQSYPYYIPHSYVLSMHQSDDGVYWLGTYGGGLFEWDKAKNSITQYDMNNGLSNNVIYSIYPDTYGNLWLSSDLGIIKINRETKQTSNYLVTDGISHNEFNLQSNYIDEDGTIYYGGLNGITYFHPSDFIVKNASNSIPFLLTSCLIYDGESGGLLDFSTDVKESKEIILEPGNNSFKLSYAMLNYENRNSNLYAYKLKGADTEWSYTRSNSVRFHGLDYGDHQLVIKAQGKQGIWLPNKLNLKVVVVTPFYRKWYFIVICVVVLILLIALRVFSQYKSKQSLIKKIKMATAKSELDKAIITEQSEKLQQLDKAKSQFFANISHELRTPLTLIMGPLERLLRSKDVDSSHISDLSMIHKNSELLNRYIEELLDISRMESSLLEVNLASINLFKFLKRTCHSFESLAGKRSIEITVDIDINPSSYIETDVVKFEKIMNNLISNSIKYTQSGGAIKVSAAIVNNFCEIRIQDTGIGIDEEELPNIFDRYYRAKGSEMAKGGLGIGLSLSHEYAKAMQGSIRVESVKGVGSLFILNIPATNLRYSNVSDSEYINDIEDLEIISLESPHLNRDIGENFRILIVEDNLDMRTYLRSLLERENTIIEAGNGIEALEILKESARIDLIISDYMMPEMDGNAFLEKVKSSPAWSKIPVIMLTARAEMNDKLGALRIGVDDYVVKPFDAEELCIRIDNLLQHVVQRKNLQSTEDAADEQDHASQNYDMIWLRDLESIIKQNVSNKQLGVELIAQRMNLSSRQLNRKINVITGLSPGKYVQEIRLQMARELLEQEEVDTVKELCYKVGFSTPKYFSKLYLARFGKLPSRYINSA